MMEEKNKNIKDSKLVFLLESFTQKELNALYKFLRSPYFNTRGDVVSFFEEILDYLKKGKTGKNKLDFFKKIYPEAETYNDQNFRLLMSYLFRLVEQFIAVQEITKEESQLKLKAASSYRQRNLTTLFERKLKQVESAISAQPYRNVQFYETLQQIQQEKYQFTSTQQQADNLNLQEISDTIDLSYLTLKLKQTCDLLSHQGVYESSYNTGFLEKALAYIEEVDLLKNPAINVYYHCYFMLKEPHNEERFKNFKPLLFKYDNNFTKSEIRDLYLAANNFCIRQLNAGNTSYFQEALDLYKEGLKKEYLLENGVLSRLTYFNIAASGLHTGEYEWTEHFIKNYQYALEKKHRESSYSFNLARLEYARKNYQSVLELLQKSNYRDLFVNLSSKVLLLKVYYETDELNLLHSHLDAMKNYIRRKRVMGYHRENYSNIVRYAKRLSTFNPFDEKEKNELKESIEKEKVLTEKDWFLKALE